MLKLPCRHIDQDSLTIIQIEADGLTDRYTVCQSSIGPSNNLCACQPTCLNIFSFSQCLHWGLVQLAFIHKTPYQHFLVL